MSSAFTSQTCRYLIIGNGRAAQHTAHYFTLLNLPHTQWARRNLQDLESLVQQSDRILLLISDNEIEKFIQSNSYLLSKKIVHFSGALHLSFAESAHPLNTFGLDLYDLATYKNIPFITEQGRTPFTELLPGLPNPHYELDQEKKALYHSLCVFGGNFSTLLWQNVFALFERELKLPKEVLFPLIEQTVQNLKTSAKDALTGPLARGDHHTISRHLDALSGRPERELYLSFLHYFCVKNSKPDLQKISPQKAEVKHEYS